MKGHPQLVVVGRVLGTRGTNGQLRVQVHSDVPHRFDAGEVLYLEEKLLRIASSVPFRSDQILIYFQDVETVSAAKDLAIYSGVNSDEMAELVVNSAETAEPVVNSAETAEPVVNSAETADSEVDSE